MSPCLPGFISEVCVGEDFNIKCSRGNLILMQKAHLGRMKIGKCVDSNIGYLGCYKNVLNKLDDLCSGQKECNIPKMVKGDFEHIQGEAHDCPKALDAYLETMHTCVPGEPFML